MASESNAPAQKTARCEVDWLNFDYANPPEDGIYWLTVNAPDYDCDVDGGGRTVGIPTGDITQSVCMAQVSTDGDGQVQFDTVDRWAFGEVPEEATVSHYAPVDKPRAPSATAGQAQAPAHV